MERRITVHGAALLLLVVGLHSGCLVDSDPTDATLAPASEPAVTAAQAVVYGDDDRYDWFEALAWEGWSADEVQALMSDAAVSIMDWRELETVDGAWRLTDESLGSVLGDEDFVDDEHDVGMCDDELFVDQPIPSFCSGTLIAPDLVLTAGHCFETAEDCENAAIVFGYFYEDEGALGSFDVYGCEELVVWEEEVSEFGDASDVDFAIVRLDAIVEDRTPATLALDGPLDDGEPLLLGGFGSGLPLKIDGGGTAVNGELYGGGSSWLTLSSDTFEGNSGGGIFNADLELVALLQGGGDDYVYDEIDDCNRVNYVDEPELGAEVAEYGVYAWLAIDALCDEVFDAELCDGGGVPGAWDCDESWYGDGECDCECGVLDVDCEEALPLADGTCDEGEVCSADGECVDAGGEPDAGTPDVGMPDAGMPDAGTPDAGTPDVPTPDAGTPDGGIDTGTSADTDDGADGAPTPVDDGGCSAAGVTGPGAGLIAFGALVLGLRRRRR